jgi:hypothetical protein
MLYCVKFIVRVERLNISIALVKYSRHVDSVFNSYITPKQKRTIYLVNRVAT